MEADKKTKRRALAGVRIIDPQTRMGNLFKMVTMAFPRQRFWNRAWLSGDPTLVDAGIRLNWWKSVRGKNMAVVRSLLKVSPYGAYAPTMLFRINPKAGARHLAKWTEMFAKNQMFQYQIAEYYSKTDPQKALPYYKNLVQKTPDSYPYVSALAEIYKKLDKLDLRRETLLAYLKQPSHGLSRANACVAIAKDYMRQLEYKKAMPYAEQAGNTWAAWAMETASEANEWAGNFARAELWKRRISERYEESSGDWFLWCQRTGKGDLAAATKLYKPHLLAPGGHSKSWGILTLSTTFYFLNGDLKTALYFTKLKKIQHPYSPLNGLMLAFLYGAAKKSIARTLTLQKIVTYYEGGRTQRKFGYYTVARHALAWFSGKEKVDPKKIVAEITAQGKRLRIADYFFIGAFAKQAGNNQVAKEYFLKMIRKYGWQYSSTAYAWVALRKMKVDIYKQLNLKKRAALKKEQRERATKKQVEEENAAEDDEVF